MCIRGSASSDATTVDRASGPMGAAVVPAAATGPLDERLDCLRTSGGLLLIGHRGGATRDYPENANEKLERTLQAGNSPMEIGISRTKDGKLWSQHGSCRARPRTCATVVLDT